MARAPLSQLNDWELEDKDQDLRGHYLMQEDGTRVGKIDEMIVDPDREQIVALRLENGQEYPISTVDLRDDEAYLLGTGYTSQTATTTTATEGAAARTPTRPGRPPRRLGQEEREQPPLPQPGRRECAVRTPA